MKTAKMFVVLLLVTGFCLGGPLMMLSYRSQSIILAVIMTCYVIYEYPHTRLGSDPVPNGDMMGSLWREIRDLVSNEDFDLPADQPATVSSARTRPADQPVVNKPVRPSTPNSGSKDPYVKEALVINGQLAKIYKLNAQINPAEIVKSWNYITYPLTQTGPLKFNDVQKIEGDLGREISALHRSKLGATERVEVLTVDVHPKMLLQVTRANPQALLWNERPKTLKTMNTVIGYYADGLNQKPLVIDMFGNDTEHVNGGFFGQPGAGKSSTLLIALDMLLANTSPEMLEVYGIDLKKNTFKRYAEVPHMAQYTSNADQAIKILDQFVMWCNEETAAQDLKYRLLVIDDFQMLINHSEHGEGALEKIIKIMQTGREWGIRVWTATQNPDKDSYPSALKPLTHFKACGHIENDNYVRTQLQIYGASKVTPKREMIFCDAFGDKRITTFWYTPEDREQGVAELVRLWGGRDFHSNAPIELDPSKVRFPIGHRSLSPVERLAVRNMKATGLSLNKLCEAVYGSKNGEILEWIKAAINEQC